MLVPGVGETVRGLLLVTKNYFFVGPDNGVLLEAAEDDLEKVFLINKSKSSYYNSNKRSFHDRDIYVLIAALMACGALP